MVYNIGNCIKHNTSGDIFYIEGVDTEKYLYRTWESCMGWGTLQFALLTAPAILNTTLLATCPTPKYAIGDCVDMLGVVYKIRSIEWDGINYSLLFSQCINGSWVDITLVAPVYGCSPLLTKITCPSCVSIPVPNIICISGSATSTVPGQIDVGYAWKNDGNAPGKFTPSVVLDDTQTIAIAGELELVAKQSTPTITQKIINLTQVTHKVCPYPNP